MPGRTDNEIKNYWNTHIRKRLLRNGIDPVTHAPRLDLLDLSSILTSTLSNQSSLLNLLGTQSLLNPQLLRLISTILSLKQDDNNNQETLLQQIQQNQLMSNMYTPTHDQFQTQLMQPSFDGQFGFQNALNNETYIPSTSSQPLNHVYASNPTVPGVQSESSSFLNQNFNLDSVMSTPLSSPSTYVNNSSSNTTEDEKESYCSSLLKFEIPESLDISDFM